MSKKERILLWAGCLVASLVGGMGMSLLARSDAHAAPPQDKTLKTTRLEITDSNGTLRAVLATGKDGNPVMAMTDTNGKVRFALAMTGDDVPGMSMVDADGKAVIGMALAKGGGGAFNLADGRGKVRGSFVISAEGDADVLLYDKKGNRIEK